MAEHLGLIGSCSSNVAFTTVHFNRHNPAYKLVYITMYRQYLHNMHAYAMTDACVCGLCTVQEVPR